MTFEFDEAVMDEAKKIAPEGILKFSFDTGYHGCKDRWKVASCRPGIEGWGTSPNEALQRFIDHSFSLRIKSQMEDFWKDNYSREKFEALNKFMEDFNG